MPQERKSNTARFAAGAAVLIAIGLLGGMLLWSKRGPTAGPAAVVDTTTKTAPAAVAESMPAVTKALPRLDSASFLRAQKTADSAAAEAAMHEPLDRYAKAFATDNLEAVVQAYPNMPGTLRTQLRKFLDNADHIRAVPNYGPATVTGDRAELQFSVRLRFTTANSTQPISSVLPYHAVIAKRAGKWEIAELRQE
jgi:hypothetical protein